MADSSAILAVVSLIISIIAFFIAIAQALQQYVSTAEGYRKCAPSVMGPWTHYRHRIFEWREFRFSVEFQTPVLFVASPTNKRGPVTGQPVLNIDGTKESFSATRTLDLSPGASKGDDGGSRQQRVHTADDERASWVTLLYMLQKAEQEGRKWDQENLLTPKGTKHDPPDYGLCVQLQGRRRLYDFQPDAITRPYATSTISHVAEMTALLGMSWRSFDPDSANLRAEGNGMTVTATLVPGVGIAVSFLVTGRSNFEAKKVIPAKCVKELLFGTVPTIFGKGSDLKYGDEQGVRRTLKYLKCKQAVFAKHARAGRHLRSVDFDVVAMLAQVFRLRGSNFKVLPNPTRDVWVDSFRVPELMIHFQRRVEMLQGSKFPSPQVLFIRNAWNSTLRPVWRATEADIDIDMREATHDVIDQCDETLATWGESLVIPVVGAHVAVVLDDLDHADSLLSTLDADQEAELIDHYFDVFRPKVTEKIEIREHESPATIAPLDEKLVSREDIWLTLIFRMCCWWALHEFDQSDAVALPPRWKDSRLPVMIL